ncbi:hypothetical protein GCM10023223_29310 [Stackebrandtia albiflava]
MTPTGPMPNTMGLKCKPRLHPPSETSDGTSERTTQESWNPSERDVLRDTPAATP